MELPATINKSINNYMQELIDKLKNEAGLTEEQAKKTLEVIKDFVVEKFPMMGGAVEKLLEGK